VSKSQISNLKSRTARWLIVAILLLTWGLRLICLDTVPAGWRDDELINIHALSGELLEGRFPLYFTGASGHEPLYHYLLAGVHAVWGSNPLSGHLLSVALGTLTVALTYALARRMFGRTVAVVASLPLAASFWSLIYSRIALRHISLPPLALALFSQLPVYQSTDSGERVIGKLVNWGLVGLLLGASLYTYPAARLLPVQLVGFFAYLALFHRGRFKRHWRGLLLALVVAALVSVPLWIAIAQGRGEAAEQSEGIGADSRITELAVPLHELLEGNPQPLLENVWTTLGMFHATGDPEWLYNIADRPVFNLLGGALFWAGVALCVFRWRRPRYFFLLLWLGVGLVPTFLSIPAASLSHSILVMPLAYIFPALSLVEICKYASSKWASGKSLIRSDRRSAFAHLLFVIFLATNAVCDIRDYFVVWPRQEMTRVLYRADYREAARYLDDHPEITDVAISSTLLGPWDRLALEVDIQRKDVGVRLFDPGRALVWSAGDAPAVVLLVPWPHAASPIDDFLGPPEAISPHLTRNTLSSISNLQSPISDVTCFANGLELVEARWMDEVELLTIWHVAEPLDLPPMPVVANPPPPGVYSGQRLKVFAHLLAADGTQVGGDDGLWVDPLTLQPGDSFIQVHRFAPSADGPYTVRLGLYDPKSGEEMRWDVLDGAGQPVADHVLVPAD
jgi:4-amino-4-deoxy-L-arabinose transferase-like glycosyltransferase